MTFPGWVWQAVPWVLAAGALAAGAVGTGAVGTAARGTPWAERLARAVAVLALARLAGVPTAVEDSPRRREYSPGRRSVWLLDGSASMAGPRARNALAALRGAPATASRWWMTPEGRAPWNPTADGWRTDGVHSRVIPALADTLRQGDVAEVTVVTDGELEDRPEDVSMLPRTCPPVRVVRVGPRVTDDVSLGAVTADGLVFRGHAARVTARVRVRSHTAVRVQVTARDTGEIPQATGWVDAPAGDTEQTVTLEVTLADAGIHGLTVEATEPVWDTVPGNARATVSLRVLRDRTRVLLLGGGPDYDLRALRGALRARTNVDLVSFFILRGDGDVTLASTQELALIPFPTDELFRSHLGSFDAVIVHELDPAPYGLDAYLPALARYVQDGGALALVGARTLRAAAWRDPPVGDLLPAHPAAVDPDPGAFNPVVTPQAAAHGMTADLDGTPWPLAGTARFDTVNPRATVLWTHPGLQTGDGAPSPVLVTGYAGAGRVLMLATGSLWRAGLPSLATGDDPGRVEQFWDRALAWLAAEPTVEQGATTDEGADERAGMGRSDRVLTALSARCGTVGLTRDTHEGTPRDHGGSPWAPAAAWALTAGVALCTEWALRRARGAA